MPQFRAWRETTWCIDHPNCADKTLRTRPDVIIAFKRFAISINRCTHVIWTVYKMHMKIWKWLRTQRDWVGVKKVKIKISLRKEFILLWFQNNQISKTLEHEAYCPYHSSFLYTQSSLPRIQICLSLLLTFLMPSFAPYTILKWKYSEWLTVYIFSVWFEMMYTLLGNTIFAFCIYVYVICSTFT